LLLTLHLTNCKPPLGIDHITAAGHTVFLYTLASDVPVCRLWCHRLPCMQTGE